MLIALCSAKGSPGVTTTMVALGACWPGPGPAPILLEADPAGGDLVARFGLGPVPGLVSLATAARHTPHPSLLAAHCQLLPGGLRVISAPVGAEAAHAALRMTHAGGRELLAAAAADPHTLLLVDAGRVEPHSPTVGLLGTASAVLIVARPRLDDLAHAATLLPIAPRWTTRPGLVLVGPGHRTAEVHAHLGVPVLAALPADPDGAAVLSGRPGNHGVRTSALGRAAAQLARVLHHYTHTTSAPASPGSPDTTTSAAAPPLQAGTPGQPPRS